MTILKPIALLVLILCNLVQPNNGNNLIEQTCNKTPDPTNCIQYLKSDPSSSNASVLQLAIIMFRVMRDKSASTLAKINQLLPKTPAGSRAYVSLKECVDLYKSIEVFDSTNAIGALQRNPEPKRAEYYANQAMQKSNQCEVHFHGRLGIGTPVSNENNAMYDIGNIAASICQFQLI